VTEDTARPAVLDQLSARRRAALWTWTWLGWRESTPAFKASLVLSAMALTAILTYSAFAR
jgi:hypothetical protein